MNSTETFQLTPLRRNMHLGSGNTDDGSSSLQLRPEMFMTPCPKMDDARSSPPALVRERKRFRRSIFQGENGQVFPQFLLPKLDDAETPRIPFRLRLTQRLTPPTVNTNDVEECLLKSCNVVSHVVTPTSSNCKANKVRRTMFRSTSYSNKNQDDDSNNANSTVSQSRPTKLKRRHSSTALTA